MSLKKLLLRIRSGRRRVFFISNEQSIEFPPRMSENVIVNKKRERGNENFYSFNLKCVFYNTR